MPQQPKRGGKAGMGVDASGGPVIDPTENVIALTKAEAHRQDDLRKAERRYFMAQLRHVEKVGKYRTQHQAKMDAAESARIDSIRQIDMQATAATNAQQLTAIQTLAASTTASAEALRTAVANTATTIATQLSSTVAEFNKRLAALEQLSSERLGQQKVADPQMERLALMVEQLARSRAADTGKTAGLSAAWVGLLGVVSLIVGLITIGGFVFITTRPPAPDPTLAAILSELKTSRATAAAAPQVIYMPSPPGTLLPSMPPAAAPR
jgi:uncharacterized iron-regulated membrane protein